MMNIVPNDITVTTVKTMLMISARLMVQLFRSRGMIDNRNGNEVGVDVPEDVCQDVD